MYIESIWANGLDKKYILWKGEQINSLRAQVGKMNKVA